MKKQTYIVVLLTGLYAIGTLGVFSSYYTLYHRQVFQAQVKEAREDRLEKLHFTEGAYKAIQWIEVELEFEWHGKMYDVHNISRTSDGYVVVCENDSLEEMLLAIIDLSKGSKEQGLKKGNPQPQFFYTYLELTPVGKSTVAEKSSSHAPSFYHSIRPEISSPPPQL